ncbi:hypothetical protein DH2020_046518 [Rehmannia glutinosa]|uniref:RRM domain-containing protein n=1 Tax=Rehmannia glutinosa TaxID=99300 RepID=A0ABR0UC47_REHGL
MANAEVEAVDFEPDDDDLMDEDVGDGSPSRAAATIPRLKSAITGGGSSTPKKTKGRGFRDEAAAEADRNARMAGRFDSLDSDGGSGPERCSELLEFMKRHKRTIYKNAFGEYGEIKNLHLNLDRRTGFVKLLAKCVILLLGYGLIEFEKFDEAQQAINEMDGTELLTQTINVDWAFSKGPFRRRNMRRRSPRGHRSRSPRRRF